MLLHLSEASSELLNDIVESYSRLNGEGGEEGEGDEGSEEGEEGSSDPISVLIDCMLSLLTRPSALTREVVRTGECTTPVNSCISKWQRTGFDHMLLGAVFFSLQVFHGGFERDRLRSAAARPHGRGQR